MTQLDLLAELEAFDANKPMLGVAPLVYKAAADAGIKRAEDHAERTEPGWVDRAAEAVREVAQVAAAHFVNGEFTVEQARALNGSDLPPPPDGRAWGAVTRRALVLGYIEPTGGYAPAASSNGSPKRLYRAGRCGR